MIIHKMKEAHGDTPDTALQGVGWRTSQNEQRLSQELSLAEKGRQMSEKGIFSKEESTWEEGPEARENRSMQVDSREPEERLGRAVTGP